MKYTLEEIKQHRQDWIAALRSGSYTQGTNYLKLADPHDTKSFRFCCLGVACDISGLGEWTNPISLLTGFAYLDGISISTMPPEVIEYYGVKRTNGAGALTLDEEGPVTTCLADMNDCAGFTFEQIADVIEKEPVGLFLTDKELTNVI